jgi:hypothetical protein
MEKLEILDELERLLNESAKKVQSFNREDAQWQMGYEYGLETAIELLKSSI